MKNFIYHWFIGLFGTVIVLGSLALFAIAGLYLGDVPGLLIAGVLWIVTMTALSDSAKS